MRVAILGCGYLGLALGRQLRGAGHDVVGVRRSRRGLEAIAAAGLSGVKADVTDPTTLGDIPPVDVLVYCPSPNDRDLDTARRTYVSGLRTVIDHFADRSSPPDRLVYTSSTGVYGDHGGEWVDESTPIDPDGDRNEMLANAEGIAMSAPFDGTVVRLAGLYGPGRYRLDRYLNGPVTEGTLNLIHRDDAAGAIRFLVRNDLEREGLVLAVDDEPISKWRFADWLAERSDTDPPSKLTLDQRLADESLTEAVSERIRANKRCSNEKLRTLGYEFAFPTFRDGYRPAIEETG